MRQSFPEALTEGAHVTVKAGAWELDREAWNLPRASVETATVETEDQQLDWQEFAATFYPERRRHNLAAIVAYGDYRQSGDEPSASLGSTHANASGAVGAWEDEGGALR